MMLGLTEHSSFLGCCGSFFSVSMIRFLILFHCPRMGFPRNYVPLFPAKECH